MVLANQATSCLRIPQYLQKEMIAFEEVVHTPAFRAENRATVLDLSGKHIAKSVLLAANHSFVLAVLPSTHQICLRELIPVLGQPIRLATRKEIGTIFNDCEWGVLGPFGCLYGIATILDESFSPEELITFESHFHALSIRMLCRDYERLENPRRLSFAHPLL